MAALPTFGAATKERVGVGSNTDPYQATLSSLTAAGTWPAAAINGKTVIIKPNLVAAMPASSGATTDPEVVRCVVDQAVAAGASAVTIVEAGPNGANFDACGYGFFRSYDPKVSLVDLTTQAIVLAPVPNGYNYGAIYIAELLTQADLFLVSVAKLKTHASTGATASSKNLFGLPDGHSYISSPHPQGRFAMHDRGLTMSIADVNRLQAIDYAVIDGIYGMEGPGPIKGTPVQMNLVLSGANAVAVDRIALSVMNVLTSAVPHLTNLSRLGFGPINLANISVVGDPFTPRTFALPPLPPNVGLPTLSATQFSPSSGQTLGIRQALGSRVLRYVEVLLLSDVSAAATVVRTIAPKAVVAAGTVDSLTWDGRDSTGALAPPGRYAIHTRAYTLSGSTQPGDAISWITVV